MIPRSPISPAARRRGFTLLEVLVSGSVLLLILGFSFQSVSLITATTTHRTKSMEITGAQRMALDTLSQDLHTLVRQHGATICWKPGEALASDQLRFLTLSRPEPDRPRSRLTAVSWYIDAVSPFAGDAPIPALLRGDAPITWPLASEDQPADFDFAQVLRRSPLGHQPVSEGALRFEALWLCRDGVLRRTPPVESIDTDGFHRVKLKEIAALVVTIASVDRNSLLTAAQQGLVAQAQECLTTLAGDDVTARQTTYERWRQEIGNIKSPEIRHHVQLLHRTYYLPK